MSKIYLVEDHDEVLKIWRRAKIAGLDLLHLDAHIDFGFFEAESFEEILGRARSVNELKQRLERSISFKNYEKDLNKQTHIGNFVYPAMKEGIVRNFTWVVPGSVRDFKKSLKMIKRLLQDTFQQKKQNIVSQERGCLTTMCLGREVRVCCLDSLPCFKAPVLLDVDTDFLVMKSLREDDPTNNIGRRKPWISAVDLVKALQEKVVSAPLVTISYSVNGGWTPMKYKYLGDDLAYQFLPKKFRSLFNRRLLAAGYFLRYTQNHKRQDYERAVRLQADYRAADNNYGPLYMMKGRYSRAQKEFKSILNVDPRNPASLLGMGRLFLRKKEYAKAKKYLTVAFLSSANKWLFRDIHKQALIELGATEFGLKDFDRAKEWLSQHKRFFPLAPYGYYLSGLIAEKEKKIDLAAHHYRDAIRCGWDTFEALFNLMKISVHCVEKSDIINFVAEKYRLIQCEAAQLKGCFKKKRQKLFFDKKLHRLKDLLEANETK